MMKTQTDRQTRRETDGERHVGRDPSRETEKRQTHREMEKRQKSRTEVQGWGGGAEWKESKEGADTGDGAPGEWRRPGRQPGALGLSQRGPPRGSPSHCAFPPPQIGRASCRERV